MMQSQRQREHGSSGELDVFGATSYFAGLPPAPDDDGCRRSSVTEPCADRLYCQAKVERDTTRMTLTEDSSSFRGPPHPHRLAGLHDHAAERHATNQQLQLQVVAKRQPSASEVAIRAPLRLSRLGGKGEKGGRRRRRRRGEVRSEEVERSTLAPLDLGGEESDPHCRRSTPPKVKLPLSAFVPYVVVWARSTARSLPIRARPTPTLSRVDELQAELAETREKTAHLSAQLEATQKQMADMFQIMQSLGQASGVAVQLPAAAPGRLFTPPPSTGSNNDAIASSAADPVNPSPQSGPSRMQPRLLQ